ncbi:SulP family inorganic anion transporter [Streptomyces anulatus]
MKRLEPVALLIGMVLVSAAVAVLSTDVDLVKDIASVPAAPPSFSPDPTAAPDLVLGAVSVALVALAQAAGIAPSMPNPDGTRSDINGDFRSQGYANLAGGLFQALPSGGSMSRTGVPVSPGARTRWAGIVSGVFLALVVLLCGSLAERIPMPAIGGLILVVGGELIWGKRHGIALVLRTSWMSAGAMAVTFLATTQLPLQQAIALGAVLSLLLYCAQTARQARLVALVPKGDGRWETAQRLADRGSHLILCGVQPPLLRLLKRSGIADRLGEDGIVPATQELFGGLDMAIVAARSRISADQDRPAR